MIPTFAHILLIRTAQMGHELWNLNSDQIKNWIVRCMKSIRREGIWLKNFETIPRDPIARNSRGGKPVARDANGRSPYSCLQAAWPRMDSGENAFNARGQTGILRRPCLRRLRASGMDGFQNALANGDRYKTVMKASLLKRKPGR